MLLTKFVANGSNGLGEVGKSWQKWAWLISPDSAQFSEHVDMRFWTCNKVVSYKPKRNFLDYTSWWKLRMTKKSDEKVLIQKTIGTRPARALIMKMVDFLLEWQFVCWIFCASGDDTYACQILFMYVHVGGGAWIVNIPGNILISSPLVTPFISDRLDCVNPTIWQWDKKYFNSNCGDLLGP